MSDDKRMIIIERILFKPMRSAIRDVRSKLEEIEGQLEFVEKFIRYQPAEYIPHVSDELIKNSKPMIMGRYSNLRPMEAVRRFFADNPDGAYRARDIRKGLLDGGFIPPNKKTFTSVLHSCLNRLSKKGLLDRNYKDGMRVYFLRDRVEDMFDQVGKDTDDSDVYTD